MLTFSGIGIGNPWSWGHGWGRWSYILGPNISSFIQGKNIGFRVKFWNIASLHAQIWSKKS